MSNDVKKTENLKKIASIALPVLILLGAAAHLAMYLSHNILLPLQNDSFYNRALISVGKSVPFEMHGASWLYVYALHGMLLIFGNTPFAGLVLQIILFFVCLLFLYLGMRHFAKTAAAAVAMAVLAFSPLSLRFLFSVTPEFFYLAVYLFGFYLTGVFFENFKKRAGLSFLQYFSAVLIGLLIGCLAWLDLYGVSLYFYFLLFYVTGKEKAKGAFFVNLTVLFGLVAGFFLSTVQACISRMGGMDFATGLSFLDEFFSLYLRHAEFDMWYARAVLAVLWILPAVAVICGAFRRPGEEALAQSDDKRGEKGEEAPVIKEKEGGTTGQEKTCGEKPQVQKKEQEKPAPGEPLHNPLPVPKKRKRPQADFAHQVKESDMKFDVEPKDGDDFDV